VVAGEPCLAGEQFARAGGVQLFEVARDLDAVVGYGPLPAADAVQLAQSEELILDGQKRQLGFHSQLGVREESNLDNRRYSFIVPLRLRDSSGFLGDFFVAI
jgi:hypothetical protein